MFSSNIEGQKIIFNFNTKNKQKCLTIRNKKPKLAPKIKTTSI